MRGPCSPWPAGGRAGGEWYAKGRGRLFRVGWLGEEEAEAGAEPGLRKASGAAGELHLSVLRHAGGRPAWRRGRGRAGGACARPRAGPLPVSQGSCGAPRAGSPPAGVGGPWAEGAERRAGPGGEAGLWVPPGVLRRGKGTGVLTGSRGGRCRVCGAAPCLPSAGTERCTKRAVVPAAGAGGNAARLSSGVMGFPLLWAPCLCCRRKEKACFWP